MYGNNDYRDYLEHHGILGQKWGVRRYQNADGTLTAEGKERYGLTGKKGTTIKEYLNSSYASRQRISDNAELNRVMLVNQEIALKEARKNRKSAINEALKDWSNETSNKQDLKYMGLGLGVAALSYWTAKILEARGKRYVSSILKGAALGATIGSMSAASINSGIRWYYTKDK